MCVVCSCSSSTHLQATSTHRRTCCAVGAVVACVRLFCCAPVLFCTSTRGWAVCAVGLMTSIVTKRGQGIVAVAGPVVLLPHLLMGWQRFTRGSAPETGGTEALSCFFACVRGSALQALLFWSCISTYICRGCCLSNFGHGRRPAMQAARVGGAMHAAVPARASQARFCSHILNRPSCWLCLLLVVVIRDLWLLVVGLT